MEACPECGARLTPTDQLPQGRPRSLWTKAFVTLGVLAVCLGARLIPLPTVTVTPGAVWAGSNASRSVMALGVQPLFAGYMLVEFAALLVPVWRPLRVGGPAGRARLHRSALMVGMVLALFQAVIFTLGLEKMDGITNQGAGFRMVTTLALLGATAVLIVLARIVDQEGLGSGFSILLLADLVPLIVRPLGNDLPAFLSGTISSAVLRNDVLVIAVLVGATVWMFSPFRLPIGDNLPHPSLLSRPACGVAPLTVVPAVLAFATAWQRINNPGYSSSSDGLGGPGATLVLSVAAAVLFVFLFNRPDRVSESWRSLSPNPPEGIPGLKAVMLESVLFIALTVSVEVLALRRMGYMHAPRAVTILLITGIVCDLVREWRARKKEPRLVPAWEIHQMYAVAPALRLLESEGIRAFAKGMRLRSLLQFFGPYVPVQILVSANDAPRAHALLQTRWPVLAVAGVGLG